MSLCTPLPGTFVLQQTHGYFVSPIRSRELLLVYGVQCYIEFTIQYNFIAKCQYTDLYKSLQYNITLLPSVNTLIARGMFCGARYTRHTFTPNIKHLITTTANKHPGKKSFIDKNEKIPQAKLSISHKIKLPL